MPSPDSPPPSPSRRERRRLEVFERILGAAETLFLEQGYDDSPVAAICERADVAYGTFFNYFPAKQDLLRALGNRSLAEIGEQLEELSKRPASIEDTLIELFEGAAQQLEDLTPAQRELAARVQALAFTDAPEERDRGFHAAFEAFLRRGVEEARVRDDVPLETLADLVSSAYASMHLSWVHIEDFPVRPRAAALARLLAATLSPA